MISNEVVEAYVNHLEETFTRLSKGGDPYARGRLLYRWFQWLKKRLIYLEVFLEGMRSREALTRLVASFPDEFETLLPKFAAIFRLAPTIFDREFKVCIHLLARENPIEGGRPEVMISIESRRKICGEILQLFGGGLSLGQSQQRIAQRRGISVRTVRRIWKERRTLNSAGPRTYSDFMNALANLAK